MENFFVVEQASSSSDEHSDEGNYLSSEENDRSLDNNDNSDKVCPI